jgi:hypothetical protein
MTTTHPNEDLRGASFSGEHLDSADFSGADLRGADFSSADLRDADFSDARLGVRPLVGAALLVLALLCSLAAGVVIGMGLTAVRDRLYGDTWETQSGAGSMLIVLVVFVGVMFWKGIDTALKAFAVTIVVLFVILLIARLAVGSDIEVPVVARALGVTFVLMIAILAGILGRVIGGTFGAWAIVLVAIVGGIAAGQARGGLAALVVSVSLVLISKRALKFDRRDRSIRLVAHAISRRWGTRFMGADLTNADFTGTFAANCNVTDAVLDGVRWESGHAPLSLDPTTAG